MQAIISYLDGKKTYLLSIAVIVYAALAYFGVAPEPDKVQAAMVIIAGYTHAALGPGQVPGRPQVSHPGQGPALKSPSAGPFCVRYSFGVSRASLYRRCAPSMRGAKCATTVVQSTHQPKSSLKPTIKLWLTRLFSLRVSRCKPYCSRSLSTAWPIGTNSAGLMDSCLQCTQEEYHYTPPSCRLQRNDRCLQ